MSLILIYIAIAFTAAALFFTVRPLLGSRRERVRIEYIEEELRMIEELVAQRAALLQQLRDLEFDRETNKVADQDYHSFKRRYELEAVGVMRQLDAIRGGKNWDDIVDRELARHRGESPNPVAVEPDAAVDADSDAEPSEADADAPESDHSTAGAPDDETSEEVSPEGDEEASEETSQEVAAELSKDVAEETSDVAGDAGDAGDDAELHCGSCGVEIDSDDRFCRNCGAATPSSQDAAEASA